MMNIHNKVHLKMTVNLFRMFYHVLVHLFYLHLKYFFNSQK